MSDHRASSVWSGCHQIRQNEDHRYQQWHLPTPDQHAAEIGRGVDVGSGGALLVVIGFLVLLLGKRLALRPCFLLASLLIWRLGCNCIGIIVRKLRIAHIVPEMYVSWLPWWDAVGVYPRLEPVLGAMVVVIWLRRCTMQLTGRRQRGIHRSRSAMG